MAARKPQTKASKAPAKKKEKAAPAQASSKVAAATKPTEAKQSNLVPWKPGQSGNPNGRPKGSRNKLGQAFTDALLADFEKAVEGGGKTQGEEVIARLRTEDPAAYVKTIAAIMPKQVEINVSPYEEMTDEQLEQRIRQLASLLEIGIDPSARGKEATNGAQSAGGVPSVH